MQCYSLKEIILNFDYLLFSRAKIETVFSREHLVNCNKCLILCKEYLQLLLKAEIHTSKYKDINNVIEIFLNFISANQEEKDIDLKNQYMEIDIEDYLSKEDDECLSLFSTRRTKVKDILIIPVKEGEKHRFKIKKIILESGESIFMKPDNIVIAGTLYFLDSLFYYYTKYINNKKDTK